ncbi:Hypothetical protein R9X50_00467500 [Acrodontium crateriforme]|uniref:Uncharacterized protein n=1 Tax=Acrodontium crateriforme TaxID=150365 RepID=A0AAQ3R595_9PEZI|nr:Hypothetical protein R9X50_00467500 [Acrodontium crateriforme]
MAFEQNGSQVAPAAANILKLSRKCRMKIFESVLIVPHQLYIFRDPGCPIELFAPDKPRGWPALIHTNRQINREAAAVLYGMNNFNFLDTSRGQPDLLEAFLSCIGPANASLISRVCINFPVIEGGPGTFELRDDSVKSLRLLREHCPHVQTIETHVQRKNSNGMIDSSRDEVASVKEALLRFDDELKFGLPFLSTIIVRFYTGYPTPDVLREMEVFGWKILRANE